MGFKKLFLFFFFSVSASLFSKDSKHYFHYDDQGNVVGFDLLDPELSPPDIHDEVILGYNILLHTTKEAPQFAGNALSCTNCHFSAGNTVGGKNGGLSLVGVTTLYPHYFARSKRVISLEERIQWCFERSLNGKAPPTDSKEIKAIVAYLKWISTEVADYNQIPWLKLKLLKSDHQGDVKHGSEVYSEECSSCHQPHGEGTEGVPPVWGYGSFNDGAGLNHLRALAAFIYYNMPYGNADLSSEDAIDVAAFILTHPRAHFSEN